jgi:type I restriction enzyme S subunit
MRATSTLRDASERIYYGLTLSATDDPSGPRFLRITDIDSTHVDWGSVPYCEASESEMVKYALSDGDIVIARTGASTGRSQFVQVAEPAVFASYLVRFRVASHFDSRYISYVLQSNLWSQYVLSVAHGKSAQPNMSARDMGDFVFVHPTLSEQQAIAEVLGALDDKIAANTKLAFVADEYVRASYTALQCVDRIRVGDVLTNRREAVDPRGLEPGTSYVGLEHIPRRSMWMSESGVAESVTSGKSRYVEGDTLFGKLRPYFHKVVSATGDGICSTDIIVLHANNLKLAGFTLAALSSDEVIAEVTAASEGTRMPRTSWKDLAAVEIPWPGESEALDFSVKVNSVRGAVVSKLTENNTLAELRDTLLPELMSGRLRVKDAVQQVGEVL